jgi:hypothetical protein
MSGESPVSAPTVLNQVVSPAEAKVDHPLLASIKADVDNLNFSITQNREMNLNYATQTLEKAGEDLCKDSLYESCIVQSKALFLNVIRYVVFARKYVHYDRFYNTLNKYRDGVRDMPVSENRFRVMSMYLAQMLKHCPDQKANPTHFKIRNLWMKFVSFTYNSVINRRLPFKTGMCCVVQIGTLLHF